MKSALTGILLICVTAYLFYGTPLAAVFLSPCLIWYMKSRMRQKIRAKKQAFTLQFKEAIRSVSAALGAGYSVENAIREANKDLRLLYKKDTPIMREFDYIIRQLDINVPAEEIFRELALRTGDDDVRTFAEVFAISKRGGGDMIGIIRGAISQISDKIDVKREIDTVMAAKKTEFKIMSAVPFAMICYIKLSFPEFVKILYGNALGVVIMTVCLLVYAAAYIWGGRIVTVEV